MSTDYGVHGFVCAGKQSPMNKMKRSWRTEERIRLCLRLLRTVLSSVSIGAAACSLPYEFCNLPHAKCGLLLVDLEHCPHPPP